jgi:hypothetical protein
MIWRKERFWTPERKALLAVLWPTYTDVQVIIERVRALAVCPYCDDGVCSDFLDQERHLLRRSSVRAALEGRSDD